MAIIAHKEKSTLRLELDNGIVDGKQKTLSKSFTKVKTDAADEDLHVTALAIADLQSKDLINIKKIEEVSLISK